MLQLFPGLGYSGRFPVTVATERVSLGISPQSLILRAGYAAFLESPSSPTPLVYVAPGMADLKIPRIFPSLSHPVVAYVKPVCAMCDKHDKIQFASSSNVLSEQITGEVDNVSKCIWFLPQDFEKNRYYASLPPNGGIAIDDAASWMTRCGFTSSETPLKTIIIPKGSSLKVALKGSVAPEPVVTLDEHHDPDAKYIDDDGATEPSSVYYFDDLDAYGIRPDLVDKMSLS